MSQQFQGPREGPRAPEVVPQGPQGATSQVPKWRKPSLQNGSFLIGVCTRVIVPP